MKKQFYECTKCQKPCNVGVYQAWKPEPRPFGQMHGPVETLSLCCHAPVTVTQGKEP